jgi:hypothetical protein
MSEGRFALERELGLVAFPLDGLKTTLATMAEKLPYQPPPHVHGDSFMQVALRLAPHAQSLVAQVPSISCDPERTKNDLRRNVQTLTNFIAQYGVRYVVMSGGATRSTFSSCPDNADLLLRLQLDEFYARVAAIPQTIFIQSAPNSYETARELVPYDPEFLIDCTPIPGRIRVSYAAIPKREVPPEGLAYQEFQESLPQGTKNTAACVDVFMPAFDQSEDSLVTSAIPPLVVAMAIAVENSLPGRLDATGAERAQRIIGDEAPRLYHPRANQQLESF